MDRLSVEERVKRMLTDMGATLFTYNSHDLDVLSSGSFCFVKELRPQETATLNCHVFANHTGRVCLHVTAYSDSALVSHYSPDQELRFSEDPAEIRTFFVNRPYWAYEKTIETETVVFAHRDTHNLRLEIAARPLSKAHTLMDVIDIEFIAEGGTKRFVSELDASEGGNICSQHAFSTKENLSAVGHRVMSLPLSSKTAVAE